MITIYRDSVSSDSFCLQWSLFCNNHYLQRFCLQWFLSIYSDPCFAIFTIYRDSVPSDSCRFTVIPVLQWSLSKEILSPVIPVCLQWSMFYNIHYLQRFCLQWFPATLTPCLQWSLCCIDHYLHRTCLQLFLSAVAPNFGIRGDFGWTANNVRHKVAMIQHWDRPLNMDDSTITKTCLCGKENKKTHG